MTVLGAAGVIFAFGLIGGLANAVIVDGGLRWPRTVDGVWQPGFTWYMVAGGIAALLTWSLNAALGQVTIFDPYVPTLAQVGSAIVVGLGGANLLSQKAARQTAQSKTAAMEKGMTVKGDSVPPAAAGRT